ncbi:ribonuclease H1-like isoform X2 [Ischnura elegans]|nr:ribonuclease H1-like isoform X2 [Ischnura elegans]
MLEGTKVPFSDLVNAPVPPPESQKRVLDVKSDAIPLKKARLESWESTPNKFTVEPDGSILVYIHGARINGRRGSQAGIGVWFGTGNNLNISAPAKGRITINSAEIEAATAAIETAHSAGIKQLTLCSDSDFLVSAITKWIQKWQTNGWKTLFDEPVKNKKEFILLDKARKLLHVQFALVQPGNYGHDQAGALARTGASKCPPRRIF